ncbi:MAG: AAA family ATPase [Bacteroidales bacterium]|nr:AAA family ATPase [Bacteroidales bacterium]
MIQRLLIKQLRAWAQKDGRKPLVLRGARQVGKTTIVKQFAAEFENYIHVNLEQSDDAKPFSQYDDVHKILTFICIQKHITLKEGRTLLFIDEIQESTKAVALLRYFYEEMPELYVIAAGSRLQTILKERISFPVGRVEYLSLRPCSFYEFLDAADNGVLLQMVESLQVDEMYHQLLSDLFNTYALIGGMPEIVASYARTKDVSSLAPIYKSLIDGYKDDAEKYARNFSQVHVIRHILQTGWAQKHFLMH